MEKIIQITGKAIPLAMNDVDTDLIIPAQYLTSVSKEGYGKNLFRRLRDNDPDFIFNQEQFCDASILITKENFACGSSREHAVWALKQAGIKAVIATSFADIFFNNSAKNGLVLIKQPAEAIDRLLSESGEGACYLTIDLPKQTIAFAGGTVLNFSMDQFLQHCFVQGVDELDYLLDCQQQIKQHKQADRDFISAD